MEPNENLSGQPVQGANGDGLAVGALITGIIALVLAFIPIIGLISWLLAPLALILGAMGLKSAKRGLAIGGLVTGGIALFICIAWVALFGFAASQADNFDEEALQELERELEQMEQYEN